MLKNVHLCREHTTPPIQQSGEFWYWKLTAYGLDLMHVLTRASMGGFSYCETFMEPEPDSIPQLVLLHQLNAVIHCCLSNVAFSPDWTTLLNCSQYLREKGITLDDTVFQREINCLIWRVHQGRYCRNGNRNMIGIR